MSSHRQHPSHKLSCFRSAADPVASTSKTTLSGGIHERSHTRHRSRRDGSGRIRPQHLLDILKTNRERDEEAAYAPDLSTHEDAWIFDDADNRSIAAPSNVASYEAPLPAHNSPTIVLQDDDLWLDDNRGTVDDDVGGWSCDDENFVSPLTKSLVRYVILNQCGKGARQTWDIVPACANIATRICYILDMDGYTFGGVFHAREISLTDMGSSMTRTWHLAIYF